MRGRRTHIHTQRARARGAHSPSKKKKTKQTATADKGRMADSVDDEFCARAEERKERCRCAIKRASPLSRSDHHGAYGVIPRCTCRARRKSAPSRLHTTMGCSKAPEKKGQKKKRKKKMRLGVRFVVNAEAHTTRMNVLLRMLSSMASSTRTRARCRAREACWGHNDVKSPHGQKSHRYMNCDVNYQYMRSRGSVAALHHARKGKQTGTATYKSGHR